MKCPHCLIDVHPQVETVDLGNDTDYRFTLKRHNCSACGKASFFLENLHKLHGSIIKRLLIYPKGINRSPCPVEVPDELREDYTEACLVLSDSPKASAALSRRCLQTLLRDYAGVKPSDLYHEIEEYCSKSDTPSYISTAVDAVRNIGNFAAHPIKSTQSGEIIPVEAGEAEWNLEVLESLFDFFFVQPKRVADRKAKLNEKLKEAGKPEI